MNLMKSKDSARTPLHAVPSGIRTAPDLPQRQSLMQHRIESKRHLLTEEMLLYFGETCCTPVHHNTRLWQGDNTARKPRSIHQPIVNEVERPGLVDRHRQHRSEVARWERSAREDNPFLDNYPARRKACDSFGNRTFFRELVEFVDPGAVELCGPIAPNRRCFWRTKSSSSQQRRSFSVQGRSLSSIAVLFTYQPDHCLESRNSRDSRLWMRNFYSENSQPLLI
jgi:hypothetical protein